MQFSMTVDMDNAAFEGRSEAELSSILESVAERVADGRFHFGHTMSIMDSNGNRVGGFKVDGDPWG